MSDNRSRIWFAFFVLAVFCAGAAAGAMIVRRIGPPVSDPGGAQIPGRDGRMRPPGLGRPGGSPSPARLIDRLDRELQLTDDQVASIQKIFEVRREPLERVQRELRERMDQEQRGLQADIRKVLTAEQQPKFDKWLEQNRGRGRGRGRGGPFGPPGDQPVR